MPEQTPPVGFDGVARRVEHLGREQERLFRELMSGERRFRRLARGVWKVQEEERRRLAGELHDGIGQTLVALKTQLERLQRRSASGRFDVEELTASVELAAQALDETRELSRLLRPPVLDDLGLGPALRWLGRTVGQRTGVAIDVRIEAADERLPPELETLVFRVAQEALTNAVKHSQAESALVRFVADPEQVRLSVRDEGLGFEPHAKLGAAGAESGFGLRGIVDRAELFGGRAAIRSSPGEGTEIEVRVPRRPGREHR